MYESFFGLTGKPFSVVPDPDFLYWSDGHELAYTMLSYGVINHSPLTVITGEVGAGKTTLLRQLLRETPDDLIVGLISNIQPGKGDLLEWVLMAFNQPYDGTHVQRLERFQEFVIECYADGKRVSLVIDEAQNLDVERLEELRMLSNINADQDLLLQIVLIGQPELREMLNWPALRQFSQRISSDYHLGTLTSAEVEEYIHRRLVVAGTDVEVFPTALCTLIHHATGGVPRLINVLCDHCLAYAYAAERDVVDEEILRELMSGIERNGIYSQFASLSGKPRLLPDTPSRRSHPPWAELKSYEHTPAAHVTAEALTGGSARARTTRPAWSSD